MSYRDISRDEFVGTHRELLHSTALHGRQETVALVEQNSGMLL